MHHICVHFLYSHHRVGEYTVFAHILLLLVLLLVLVLLPKSFPRRHAFILGPNDLKFGVPVHFTNTPTRFFHFFDKVLRTHFIGIFGSKWPEKHIFGSCTLILSPNDLKFGTVIVRPYALRSVVSDFLCGPEKCRNYAHFG